MNISLAFNFSLGAIGGGAQGLLLAMCSEIPPGGDLGTLGSARDLISASAAFKFVPSTQYHLSNLANQF